MRNLRQRVKWLVNVGGFLTTERNGGDKIYVIVSGL